MYIKQISIFIENKPGRLLSITRILEQNQIDIRALSVSDTKDFGILRLIVSDPDKACEVLRQAECTVTLTEVIGIGIKDRPGGLAEAVDVLDSKNINIEYMYAFISRTDETAYVILRVEDNAKAVAALNAKGISVISGGI